MCCQAFVARRLRSVHAAPLRPRTLLRSSRDPFSFTNPAGACHCLLCPILLPSYGTCKKCIPTRRPWCSKIMRHQAQWMLVQLNQTSRLFEIIALTVPPSLTLLNALPFHPHLLPSLALDPRTRKRCLLRAKRPNPKPSLLCAAPLP